MDIKTTEQIACMGFDAFRILQGMAPKTYSAAEICAALQPAAPAVKHEASELPPLPEWSKQDDLDGLVPSQIRQELRAYGQACRQTERISAAQWKAQADALMQLIEARKSLDERTARQSAPPIAVPAGFVLRREMPRADVDDEENDKILHIAGECGFAYDGHGSFEAYAHELIAFGKAMRESPIAVQGSGDAK